MDYCCDPHETYSDSVRGSLARRLNELGVVSSLTGDKVDKYKAVVTCEGGTISVKLRVIRGLTLILR